MFSNNLLAGVSGQSSGGYTIDNSLRFNDDDSAYLSRTPATAGNRKKWTWSGWVKRGNLGSLQILFAASNESTTQGYIGFGSSDAIGFFDYVSTSNVSVGTNAVLRDSSGWYHIVVVFDTTQAIGSDRVKFYINGVDQDTTYTLTPSLNYEGSINTTGAHGIGREEFSNTYYFDGYMAEVNFIDGQALTADDFGQIDAITGEWSPKAYEGTYGTNGFYLPFNGNANDSSGNGNNWTENNLASTDYMIDTPTNNFATLNPSFRGGEIGESLAEGNLYYNSGDGDENYVCASQSVSSGKWYFEILPSASDTHGAYGFTNADNLTQSTAVSTNPYDTNNGGMIVPDGNGSPSYKINSTSTSISVTTNSVFGIALDADTGGIEFFENGVSVGSGTITGITNYIPFASMFSGSVGRIGIANFNFGADSSFAGLKTRQGNTDANGIGDFYYTPPTGYLALCTDNLAEPAIVDSETQFNVVTYTGNSADRNIDVGFEADFVWLKRRDSAPAHRLYDSVRGNGKALFSNLTNAEYDGVNDGVHFDYANGFNIDVGLNVESYNETGGSYVAWCWKAGGTAVTNTDGTITSQVSANVNAGFSIVSYTGTRTSAGNDTIGHGLGIAPSVVISKSTSNASRWVVQHSSLGTDDFLELNTTAAVADSSAVGAGALPKPTSSVFYGSWLLGLNVNTQDFIAYCFAEVEGFSKFGSYTGNGSTNGPFVYTGFRPAFVMMKRTDSTSDWTLLDTSRSTYNVVSNRLWANLSTAESTAGLPLDIVSNGFKLRTSDAYANASGGSYIYMAFAESPTKFSLGR